MIFKARLGRVLAGAFGAILAFAMTGTAYADTTSGVVVVSNPSTVTVHVYNNNNNSTDVEGTGNEVADASTTLGTAIEGATLSYYKVGELVQYTTNGKTSLKYAVDVTAVSALGLTGPSVDIVTIDGGSYYLCDASDLQEMIEGKTSSGIRSFVDSDNPDLPDIEFTDTDPTGSEGAVTVENRSGLYLFIGKSMPSHVTTEVVPFFVSAPMPADGSWNANIHVYPKVQTADAMQITHEVKYKDPDGSYAQSMSANSGTTLEYQIVVKVPENVKNLEEFSVAVELPSGLSLEDGSGNLTSATGVTLDSSDYTISSTGNKVDFFISENALLKFDTDDAEGSTITITYEAKINNTASLAAPIDSTATLTYKFKNAAEVNPAPDATATVYTYGIDLTKSFEGATEYPSVNAQFGLYTNQECTDVVAVSSINGEYWVDSSSSTTAMDVAQIEATADGTLTIKGLAAGTYYLKETVAPDGYGKIQNPITIVVNKGTTYDSLEDNIKNPTATVNGAKATIDAAGTGTKDGLVQLTVENQQLLFGFLPKTGDVGTFIFIAAGIGLVCAAVVYLTSRRRKNISNSH